MLFVLGGAVVCLCALCFRRCGCISLCAIYFRRCGCITLCAICFRRCGCISLCALCFRRCGCISLCALCFRRCGCISLCAIYFRRCGCISLCAICFRRCGCTRRGAPRRNLGTTTSTAWWESWRYSSRRSQTRWSLTHQRTPTPGKRHTGIASFQKDVRNASNLNDGTKTMLILTSVYVFWFVTIIFRSEEKFVKKTKLHLEWL